MKLLEKKTFLWRRAAFELREQLWYRDGSQTKRKLLVRYIAKYV